MNMVHTKKKIHLDAGISALFKSMTNTHKTSYVMMKNGTK